MTNAFCGTCNRLRLTTDGRLMACLFGAEEFDFKSVLRSSAGAGRTDEDVDKELLDVISLVAKRKGYEHPGSEVLPKQPNRPIVSISG